MLFYQASLPVSSATLRFVAGVIRAHHRWVGTRWRVLDPGRQALLTLVYLRKGDTYADLAPGFGVSVATVYRRVNETIDLLASRAETLPEVLGRASEPGGRS